MTKINFVIPDDLLQQADARGDGNLSDGIRQSLGRYFYLLSRSRARLREIGFSPEELADLAQVGNGTVWYPETIEGLLWNLEDSLPHELPHELPYPEAREALIAKLRTLTLTDHAALVDCVERWWRAVGLGVNIEIASMLEEPDLDALAEKR